MLRNYLKMAIKVLLRKKFYTFISMFGISITLAILLVVTSFWEHATGEQAPEVNLDRSLVVSRMKLKDKRGGNYMDGASFYFLDHYVRKLSTPEKMSFYSFPGTVSAFIGDRKVNLDRKFADAAFWEVLKFKFIEGRGYTAEEVENSQSVAVISRSFKEKAFGKESAAGKEVKINQDKFRVVGVVEDVSFVRYHTSGDLYLPVSLDKGFQKNKNILGNYAAMLVAENPGRRKEIQKEYAAMMQQVEIPEPHKFESAHSHADTYLASYTRTFLGNDETNTGVNTLYATIGLIAFLFIMLPTVNLVNINISRTMERASEIGARKAMGASSFSLVLQFLVENLVLTVFCGVLAVGLAYGAMEAINASQFIEHLQLTINYEILIKGMLFALFFGLLSGVYPAWRMSRLQAAEALKI